MSRVLKPFEYYEPSSLDEAVALLDTEDARVLAGGVDLVLRLRNRQMHASRVVNIARINGLDYVAEDSDGTLRVGAMTSMQTVAQHPRIKEKFTALAEGNAIVGSLQTKLMSTVVGNLCVSTPVSDVNPALYVMGGNFVVHGVKGERVVSAEEFFTGLGTTALEAGEMVKEITLSPHELGWGSALEKSAKTHDDISKACVAVALALEGGKIADIRIALGAVAVTTVRARKAEAVMVGEIPSETLATEAGALAAANISPISDVRSTAQYRKQIIRVMVRDCILKATMRHAEVNKP